MTARRIDTDALLDLATEMLRAEVLPALSAEQRYAGAMIANALEIARRGLAEEVETAEWALLSDALRTLLIAELRVRNPRFLASRGIGG